MRTHPKQKLRTSPTQEDYIRAIFLLQENEESVGVVSIAESLGLSKSTVSERIKELTEAGLTISKPYSPITLTKRGKQLGEKMTYKHRLIEFFLHETLLMPADKIHNEAHLLEHAFSDEAIEHLAAFLNHPKTDPHGSPINKK